MFITKRQLYSFLSNNGFTSITHTDGTVDNTQQVYGGELAYNVPNSVLAQATEMPDIFNDWVQTYIGLFGSTVSGSRMYYDFQNGHEYGRLSNDLALFYESNQDKVMQAFAHGYVLEEDVNPTYYYVKVFVSHAYPVSNSLASDVYAYLVLDTDNGTVFFQKDKVVTNTQLIVFTKREIDKWFPQFSDPSFLFEVKADDLAYPESSLTTTTTSTTLPTATMTPTNPVNPWEDDGNGHYYPTNVITVDGLWQNVPENRVNIYPYVPSWWELNRPVGTTTTVEPLPMPSSTTTTEVLPTAPVTYSGTDFANKVLVNGESPYTLVGKDNDTTLALLFKQNDSISIPAAPSSTSTTNNPSSSTSTAEPSNINYSETGSTSTTTENKG